MCDCFRRKIHRYSDEMMNTYSKYMIIRYICVHQILINGYLSMNGKYALPCRFSFGEYSDEKLMSIHTANIQMFICRFIKLSDFHPSSTRLGNGIGRVPICATGAAISVFRGKGSMGLYVGFKVRRLRRHGNNLHPHASGSILPMNLASDSPTQKSLRKRKRPPRQPTTKEKTTRGVCDGCNADGLPTLCSHCHVCKVGKQGGQSKAGRDGRRTGIYRQEIP